MADVKYIISADTKGAVTGIKKVEGSIKGMKTQATQSVSPLKGMFGQLATGLIATVGIGIAFKKLTRFLKDSIEKATEQEFAEKGLTDALASTGREVTINAKHFKDYASELQQATLYGDEAILGAEALLIQLTDLDRDGLERATAGALGMATVFKTDLKSATNLIAKALAGNYGALSRYGISVADLNTEEEKRASLLDQLTILYERAKGEVDTYGGTVTQLKNTFGDFQEKIGDVIVESDELRGAIGSIQDLMNNFIASGTMDSWASKFDLIVQNVPIFKALKDSIFLLNVEMEGQIAKQKHATEIGEGWHDFLKDSDESLKILGVDLYGAMREFAGLNDEVDDGKKKFSVLTPEIEKTNEELEKIEEIITQTVLPAYREWSGLAYNTQEEIKTHVFNANDDIVADTETTMGEISPLWDSLSMDLSRSFGDAFEDILTEGSDFGDALNLLFDGLVNSIRGFFGQMVTDFLATNVFDFMKTAATEATKSVAESVGGLAKGAAGTAAGVGPGMLATGLGAAAGTFLGTILGGGGMSGATEEHIHEIADNTFTTKDLLLGDYKTEFHILQNAATESQKHLFAIQARADVRNRLLTSIDKNLKGSVSAQGGFYSPGLSSDTIIRAHKGEAVSISRSGGSSGLWNATKYGHQKIHERSIIKR